MRMDGDKGSGSFSLFLPLTGQEQSSRLEEKFCHYLDYDEETDALECTANQAGSSKLNLQTEGASHWLHTQRRASSSIQHGRGRHKKKRSDQPDKKQTHELKSETPESKCSRGETKLQNKTKDDDNAVGSVSMEGEKKMSKLWQSQHEAGCNKSLKNNNVMDFNVDTLTSTNDNKALEKAETLENMFSWTGISSGDTERPKLAIKPVSEKVELRLSADEVQPPVIVPATINQYLRDYQREGIRFLYKHYMAESGAILGDDMGLGKTIQVIGFLLGLLGKQGNQMDTIHTIPKFIRQMSDDIPGTPPRMARRPFLIIGPSAVMYNWLDELNTWGYFTASKYHGADKDLCFDNLKKGKLEIVVTTFETFRDSAARLNEIDWEAVIVDEVHKIKGLKAQVTKALRSINTPRRFGLTGTALQNNMTELWSLLDWVQPGVLGTLEEFETEYVQVIEVGQRHDATKRELAEARKQKDKFSVIRKRMLLRRTKALIADQLPTKEDLVVMCRLSDLQINVYKAILSHPDMELVLRAEDPCDCKSRKNRAACCYKFSSDGTKAWSLVFSFMHLLLKAANHTALLIPDIKTKQKQIRLAKSVCEIAFKEHPQFLQQAQVAAFRTLSDPKYCGKMKILQGLLHVFHANHDKVLVFSYSTRLLDIIEQYVISQGHTYRRIDGKISSRLRRDIVNQFNSDTSIFLCLVSTKAGGLGLNLTGANRVVIFDPNWNPSYDLQAQDRAYRIGQTRDVKVYRLVSAGTIEENIYLRQIYKQQLDEVAVGTGNAKRYFHGIQGDKGNQGELFGIKNMFSMRTGDSCLTMDILKRNEKLEKCLAGYDITQYVPPHQYCPSDSMESEDEGSGSNQTDSSEEEEEDDEFLRELFGPGRITVAKGSARKSENVSPGPRLDTNIQCSVKSLNTQGAAARGMESGSDDDDELSLIPRLYPKSKHLICDSINLKNKASDASTSSSQNNTSAMVARKDLSQLGSSSLISDITFSTSDPVPAALLEQQFINPEKRKRGAISGISWLFSDGEADDENSEMETDGDNSTNIQPLDSSAKQIRTSPYHEESNNWTNIVQENTRYAKNASAPKKANKSTEISMATGKKSGKVLTPETDLLQEHLVLKNSSVLHIHTNAGVVGSSRAEDHMTNCAMKDVFELHTNSQVPALLCDPYSQEGEAVSRKRRGKHRVGENHNAVKCISSGSFKILVGQTPTAIARQQWSDLCKSRDSDQVKMAEIFLNGDMESRLRILREFYSQKHSELSEIVAQIYTLPRTAHAPDKDKSHGKSKTSDLSKTINSPESRSVKSPRGHSTRTRSRSNIRRDKTVEKSNAGSSQSEDSVTAVSLENQDSWDDNCDTFLPLPPSSSKKLRLSMNVINNKKSKTRLREKVKINRRIYNGKKSVTYCETTITDDVMNQTALDSSSISHIRNDSVTNGANRRQIVVEPEDISSLLHEMGQTSSMRTVKGQKSSLNLSSLSKACSSKHDNKHDLLSCSDKIEIGKKASKTAGKTKSEQVLISGKRNFGTVLDDIFFEDKPVEKHSSPRKTEDTEANRSHVFKSDFKQKVSNSDSKYSAPSNTETVDTLHSQTEFSLFDDFLGVNTLKDEKVHFFIQPMRNKDHTEKEARSLEKTEVKGVKYDFDDLNWCNFNTDSRSSHSQNGSESLFS